jgi:hypothetical protein
MCAVPCAAQTFQTLYSFPGDATEGALLYKGVTLDKSGNAYGTAAYGVDNCSDSTDSNFGCGSVFRLSTANSLDTLVTFTGTNGASPAANLALKGSNLYSTTPAGGANNLGTLFEVKTDGTHFKLLRDFDGTDGDAPSTLPVFDSAGDLFSTTPYGGPAFTGPNTGFGVLYEVTKAGQYIQDHDFSGGADGGQPERPVMDKSGNIYAGTQTGGSCTSSSSGCGVVFEYTPSTGAFQVLHTFATLDGANPGVAGVDSKGNIFGISFGGGANSDGTLWELTPAQGGAYNYVKLWDFTGGADGANPYTPLLASKDVLYGTSIFGGTDGYGVLWSYGKKTGLVQLHSFSGSDGAFPTGTPVINKSSGAVIGTTRYGGSASSCTTTWGAQIVTVFGCGTIYSYQP